MTPPRQSKLDEILKKQFAFLVGAKPKDIHPDLATQQLIDEAKTALNQYMLDSFIELIKSGLPEKRSLDDEPQDKDGVPYRYNRAEVYSFNAAIDQAENQLRQAAKEKFK